LPPGRRTAAGYRVYTDDTLALLVFVTQARRLGFRLDEIKQLRIRGDRSITSLPDGALAKDRMTICARHICVVHINALRVRSRTTGRLSSDPRSRGVESPASMPSMTARAALYALCAASFWSRSA
jgi:hypothetical protein